MGEGTKELDRLKYLSTKIQEVTSNVAITEINKKQYAGLQLSVPATQGALLVKVTRDIDGFTAEPVFRQCKMFKL